MTRQPSTEEREENMTWEEGRVQERLFFESQWPWCEEEKTKLGTDNLIMALSEVLSRMIAKRYASQSFYD
jgi:hypothetical protein